MRIQPTTNSWVTCLNPNPKAHLRLFCFPYAGGGASIYRTWSGKLPPAIEICPVQLPGRESRLLEPTFTQLEPLVQALADALYPYLNMPFAFFGHSMGALISIELARHLYRQHTLIPVYLFISGHRAPQIPNQNPPIHHLPEPAFIGAIRRLNGTPEPVLQNVELMQLLLPTLRADFALCENYIYSAREPLDCPISTFGGFRDHQVSRDDLMAWHEQTRSFFKLRMLPGDHFFLHNSLAPLLKEVSQDLSKTAEG